VKKGRKSPIQNWSELRACMRRTFIPPSFDLDHEIEKKKIEIAIRNEEYHLTGLFSLGQWPGPFSLSLF